MVCDDDGWHRMCQGVTGEVGVHGQCLGCCCPQGPMAPRKSCAVVHSAHAVKHRRSSLEKAGVFWFFGCRPTGPGEQHIVFVNEHLCIILATKADSNTARFLGFLLAVALSFHPLHQIPCPTQSPSILAAAISTSTAFCCRARGQRFQYCISFQTTRIWLSWRPRTSIGVSSITQEAPHSPGRAHHTPQDSSRAAQQ